MLECLAKLLGKPSEDLNIALIQQAFVHRSFRSENENVSGDNERLEFLGDAVLDLLVAEELMRVYPDVQEGDLSKYRSSVVNTYVLGEVAKKIDLGKELSLSIGEDRSGGREKTSLLADAFEALMGALYLSFGLEICRLVVTQLLTPFIEQAPSRTAKIDHKTILQEHCQKAYGSLPDYQLVRSWGPDHDKWFEVRVDLPNGEFAIGEGQSKKLAQQTAAKIALCKVDSSTESGEH